MEIRERAIVLNDEAHYEFVAAPKKRRQGSQNQKKKATSSKLVTKKRKRTSNVITSVPEFLPPCLPTTSSDQSASNDCSSFTGHGQILYTREGRDVTVCLPHDMTHAVNFSSSLRQLDDDMGYLHLLVTQNAVTPVDEFYRAFAVQDIDLRTKLLKDEFLIVNRAATKVPDDYVWLYGCSCNRARQKLLDSFSPTLTESVEEDFEEPYGKCRHIKAVEKLASRFGGVEIKEEYERRIEEMNGTTFDHSYQKIGPKVVIYSIEGQPAVVIQSRSTDEITYSVVKVDFKGPKPVMKCSLCWNKRESCDHTNAILTQEQCVSDVSQPIIELLNSKPKWRSRYIPVPVSINGIPFSPAPEEQKKNRFHLSEMIKEDGYVHLIPDDKGQCDCGGEWHIETVLETTSIICCTDIIPAKVYIRRCSRCDLFKDYDGLADQVLNMGVYLVTHTLLRRYLRQFVTEGTPLIKYYQELCWQQLESGNLEISTYFPYNRFRYSWYGFLNLLETDYNYGFSCPICGDHPETVVMDGVSLGIRKSFFAWKKSAKVKPPSSLDGSSHNTRVFINNARTRTLLSKFCVSGLTVDECDELRRAIALYQPSLSPFFINFDSNKCPDTLVDFFMCLASNYPVCGWIHFDEDLFDLMIELSAGSDMSSRVSDTMSIKTKCPVLAQLLLVNKWVLPDSMKPVLVELVSKARAPFKHKHNIPCCDDSCPCSGEGFFPKMPKLSHRGGYVLDDKKSAARTGCRKLGTRHQSLIPGIFTLSCHHGICYGFQIMEDVESPNVPFTILRTRFKKAPKLIVYDNACNLHNYCLNRDPIFFRDSWFLVDRFHWVNHVGCHQGYNLSAYMQFNTLNSQVAEQRNATLKKLKSMLSYMNLENFNNHLSLFLWFRSMISVFKIDQTVPAKDATIFKSLITVYSKLT